MTRLPELIQDLRASHDGPQVAELEELMRSVPKLIGLLPAMVRDPADARHSVAVATMISRLTGQLDNVSPLTLVSCGLLPLVEFLTPAFQSPKQLRGLPVDETTKLHHARSIAHSQFLKTLEAT